LRVSSGGSTAQAQLMAGQQTLHRRRNIVAQLGVAASVAMLTSFKIAAQGSVTEITVVAASDLQFVLPELIKLYNASGVKIQLRFGASGTLATQIIRGLACDVFLSADAAQVEKVQVAGLAASEPFMYAQGHVALASLRNSTVELDDKLVSAKTLFERELTLGKQPKFAIANPMHAPYGMAAQQTLETLGLWEFFKPHLVMGENVAQAAQFIASGSAVIGIVGVALCNAPALSKTLRCKELVQSLHKPIRQTAVLVKNPQHTGDEAKKFLLFLKSEKAKALLSQHGFSSSSV
jgi:molybdate transport system substrate-binding protein